MCRGHAELQTLELVRCVGTSRACLPAIAAHGATLGELCLDESCAGPACHDWAAALDPLLVCALAAGLLLAKRIWPPWHAVASLIPPRYLHRDTWQVSCLPMGS